MNRFCCAIAISFGLWVPALSAQHEVLGVTRYHLRANDVLKVTYHLTPELDANVSVQPDGYVILPRIGEVKVAGLDLKDATRAITQRATDQLNNPEVTVEITQFEKPHFFVGGRVTKPGQYTLNGPLTALQAIQIAEGFEESANEKQVLLIRPIGDGIGETHILNLKRDRRTVRSVEFFIQDGDTLVVSQSKFNVVAKYLKLINPGVYVPLS